MADDVPSAGGGWEPLVARVDALALAYVREREVPGMTVAVAWQGRLVLSRSYGYADAAVGRAMLPSTRSRIGSVTKAVVTGPAGVELLRERGLDPATTRLYGPDGVFSGGFDVDIDIAATRFYPIAAAAIDREGRVFAWYTDGTYSVGDLRVLDRCAAPRPYTVPQGKRPDQIRSIAFARDGRTHTWYDDGTHSLGTPARLGTLTMQGERAARVELAPGRSIREVVGIGIDKASDEVIAWYDDGMFSVGTALALGGALQAYRASEWPAAGSRDIRDVDIGPDGKVVAWFRDDSASVGRRDDLTAHSLPFKVRVPVRDDRTGWYREITIEHLLQHRAGFERSGDAQGMSRYFGKPAAALTYEHGHRYFLQTRKLMFRPGTASSYSNHGFGLWVLLVPALTRGELSFRDLAWSRYLEPLGLRDAVVPISAELERRDAAPHERRGARAEPFASEDASEALAAGEYTASAEELLRITTWLAAKYGPQELDRMGWGMAADGRLSHSGLIRGGAALVSMFPEGYRTAEGVLLGGIHVALAVNIGDAGDAEASLGELARDIALVVPATGVPPDFDRWQQK